MMFEGVTYNESEMWVLMTVRWNLWWLRV